MNRAPATVYLVEDDDAVLDSTRLLLEAAGYSVQCFDSASGFLQRLKPQHQGCLVVDVRMPGMSGVELHDELLRRKVGLPIVFITGHGDVGMAVQRMKLGAVDFLEKPFSPEALAGAIERGLQAADVAQQSEDQRRQIDQLLDRLTSRERQVLELIVAGRLNKQIADDLQISIKTVEAHRANLMQKLDARSMADLMRIALSANRG